MQSISIDYLFNRIYDVLLSIKYVWLFVLLRKSPDDYLLEHTHREFDGLRDRGWFDAYLAEKANITPVAEMQAPLWQKILESLGYTLPDSDGDGIPDVSDDSPYDSPNVTEAQLKERYQADYTFMDHVRDLFGIGPSDADKDSVPNSYELAHGPDPKNPDTDMDGISDGRELLLGSDPLNSDTDGDLTLDGRDAHILDPVRSIEDADVDTDGDGVGDRYEGYLSSDVSVRDTDGDGIQDNMDTYPTDEANLSNIVPLDIGQATGLQFSVQNPLLAFLSSLLSVFTLVVLVALVYASFRWFLIMIEGLGHYDHHFRHNDEHPDLHVIKDKDGGVIAGIPNLPVHEEAPASPPTPADFVDHPRFAIVQGYMSSTSEALWRIGILEADNMLAMVLKEKGYEGETVADMLKNASFKTVQLAWDAHGVRNRIAHEGSEFELTEREARRAFGLFESVFRELKVIR